MLLSNAMLRGEPGSRRPTIAVAMNA